MNRHHSIAPAAVAIALMSTALPVASQLVYETTPYKLTVEAYANLTGAYNTGEDHARDRETSSGLIDAEMRFLGTIKTTRDLTIGSRVTLHATSDEAFEFGKRSFLVQSGWGRVELGKRRGLPDVLSGYAPNAYQFVPAEFGPQAFVAHCRNLVAKYQEAARDYQELAKLHREFAAEIVQAAGKTAS